jgi:hypothetical protein
MKSHLVLKSPLCTLLHHAVFLSVILIYEDDNPLPVMILEVRLSDFYAEETSRAV